MKNTEELLTERVVDLLTDSKDVQGKIGRVDRQDTVLSLLGADGLTKNVREFVEKLSPDAQQQLLDGKTIKGNSDVNLAASIGRAMVNIGLNDKATEYTGQKAAVSNFESLDKSKFEEKGINIATDIATALTTFKKSLRGSKKGLNYSDELKPGSVQVTLITSEIPSVSPEKQDVIIGLATGMIAKIAGQSSPFNDADLKKRGSLSSNVLLGIQSAAVELANDPKYSNLTKEEAMLAGKVIGENEDTRKALYKVKNTQDPSVLADVLTGGKGKGKSVDDLSAPVAVSEKKAVDMGRLDLLAERLEKQQSPAIDSSSSSRSDGSNRSRRGSFADDVRRREVEAATQQKGK
jgi:hypothetical protein